MKKQLIILTILSIIAIGCSATNELTDQILEQTHVKEGIIVSVGEYFGANEVVKLTYSDGSVFTLLVPVVPDSWFMNEVSTIIYTSLFNQNTLISITKGGVIKPQ